jgi:hypothetical protein
VCCEDCYNGYKKKLKLNFNDPYFKKNSNLNEICENIKLDKDFKVCEMFKCNDCSKANEKQNQSDIEISPLTLRSEKDIKISIIKNYSENADRKNHKNNSKINMHPNLGQDKSSSYNQNVNLSIKPENKLNNIISNPLHKNNHIVSNFDANKIKHNSNIVNNNENKNNLIKDKKQEDKISRETKKEKVTCLSMCLLI